LADLDAAITAALEVKPAPVEPTHVTPADEEWPEPKPLHKDLPAVPAFDFACLPDTLRPWIEDIAERMQCPPDFPAVGAMIALGSLVGRKIGIRPKRYDDWLVIPNLWGCVVGRPGVMKTPALEQPLLPLRRLVAEAFERYEGEMQQHRVNAMLKSQRKRLAENKIQKQLKGGDEQAARAEAEAVLKNEASCNRRRAFLYLPPKASHFGCRLCHHLTYRSSQESHLIDINAQLQRLQTQFDKRMRQSSKRSTA
jgi:putative DNA primase/helicase